MSHKKKFFLIFITTINSLLSVNEKNQIPVNKENQKQLTIQQLALIQIEGLLNANRNLDSDPTNKFITHNSTEICSILKTGEISNPNIYTLNQELINQQITIQEIAFAEIIEMFHANKNLDPASTHSDLINDRKKIYMQLPKDVKNLTLSSLLLNTPQQKTIPDKYDIENERRHKKQKFTQNN